MWEQDSDLTDNVPAQSIVPAGAHLELQIVQQGQREFRFPFLEPDIVFAHDAKLAFPDGSDWRARLARESVSLHNDATGEVLPLVVGRHIDLESSKIWLVDARQPPLGRLEGLSDPFTGRVWTIDAGQSWVGRQGKRFNHIELNHATISRAHATFIPDQHGEVNLLAESGASAVAVNGAALAPTETVRLKHGDLLVFGGLQFRFHGRDVRAVGQALLNVNSLGTLQVAFGAPASAGKPILTRKASWLMGLLAASWGAPRSVETLLEWLWPDLSLERARRNLSAVLAKIREELDLPAPDFESLLLRTPSTLALNPERLGIHDYIEARKLTQSRAAIVSDAAAERLLDLYQGPFLETCHEDWAHTLRQSLELDLQSTLLATGRYCLEQGRFELLGRIAAKCLELEPLCEEAAVLLMESHLRTAQPRQALKVYDEIARLLGKEGLEPSTDLLRLQLQASMLS